MEEELAGLGGGAVFEDGSLLSWWYDGFFVVFAVIVTGYLTYRTIRWYGWTGRWPLATKALSVLGTVLVLLVALDRLGINTLSMNSTVYGFGSVVGGGFATLAGLVAVVRSKLAERREGKPAGKTDAEAAALPEDVGIQGATQVFTRVRGADAWLVTRSGDETGAIVNVKGSNIAVGSQEGADIRIGDASVDPSHAIIRADQGAYTVLDLGSSAGT